MDKATLGQYIDTCRLIRELERDIKNLEKRRGEVVHDVVKGSDPEFPYTMRTIHIEGVPDSAALERKIGRLKEQLRNASKTKEEVEKWIAGLPVRIQRIVHYRYIEGRSWENVARQMGRKATGESVRKEVERMLKNN